MKGFRYLQSAEYIEGCLRYWVFAAVYTFLSLQLQHMEDASFFFPTKASSKQPLHSQAEQTCLHPLSIRSSCSWLFLTPHVVCQSTNTLWISQMRSSSTQGHTRHPPFDFQDQANATTFLFYLKLSRLENSNLVYVTPNEPNQYGGNLSHTHTHT